jgi:subtilisin family serine protease
MLDLQQQHHLLIFLNGKIYDSSNEYISGTSFSAAYVSGAAALALGKFGAMPPSQLAYHLIFTANTGNCKKSVDSTGIVSTTDCGAGMVDVPHVFLTPP